LDTRRGSQREYDFPLLPILEIEWNTNSGTGVQTCTGSPGKIRDAHGCRIRKGSISPYEFSPVATGSTGCAVGHISDSQERDAICEFQAVWILSENSVGGRADFRSHVHPRLRWQICEHPLDITR